jgi:hypothetical protein
MKPASRRNRLRSLRLTPILAALWSLSSMPANAMDITWAGPSGGDWNNLANWSPARLPGVVDTAILRGAVASLHGSVTVGSVQLTDSGLISPALP